MFNEGGRTSEQRRRDVDLYVDTDNVDEVYERLQDRVEVVEGFARYFYARGKPRFMTLTLPAASSFVQSSQSLMVLY